MTSPANRKDLGSFTHFEHVNFRVPDHHAATLFFVEGLGLTRDPMRMVSVRNMWVNVGRQQFHLPIGEAAPFAGEVGLTVPDVPERRRALEQIAPAFKGTEFDVAEDDGDVVAVSPWGHVFRLHRAGELSGSLPQAIPYVRFWVPPGSARGIADFYRDVLGVPAATGERGRVVTASVNVGIHQQFHFEEKRDLTLTNHPNHVAVYLTRYQTVYAELERRNLLMEPDRAEQFRFSNIVDPGDGTPLFEFEHEMRSLYHSDYMKPLINRIPVPYPVD